MGITSSCFHHLKEVEKRENGECSGGGVEEVIEHHLKEVEKRENGECSGGGVEEVIEHHLKEEEKRENGECSGGGVEEVIEHHLKEVEKKESGECSGGGVEEVIEHHLKEVEKRENGECSGGGVEEVIEHHLKEVEKKESGECSGGGVEEVIEHHLKEVEKKESGECSGGGVEEVIENHLKEVEKRENGECSGGGVEEVIEHSKVHWSTLSEVEDDEKAEVSNVEEFLALQRDPNWGGFFATFGYDLLGGHYKRMGELVVGKKFAEGAQAELYDCKVKWWKPVSTNVDLKKRREYVLKVFKKGTYLKHLKSQLPHGLLQFYVEDMKNFMSSTHIKLPRFQCSVYRGTLLQDGRFAFLMVKEDFDLRRLIDEKMKLRSDTDCGPFSKEEVELFMYHVALGVEWLHKHGIVHRDLKASNVLVKEYQSTWPKWQCYVADYECSIGVGGTGFFRAPEILQALKDRKVEEKPEVFSEAADIYGYGMICYEVLTGKLPFEERRINDYDHVLSGHRPLVPEHVLNWVHELLDRCWQLDPAARPCIGDVLSVILTHSKHAGRREEYNKISFGESFREGYGARESRS